MRLRDLEAAFIKHTGDGSFKYVPLLCWADGVLFLCPACYKKNGGPIGTHCVICWFAGKVPDSVEPGPGRWTPQGNRLDDLTFVPGTPPRAVSVWLKDS